MNRYFTPGQSRVALALCLLAVAGSWLGWFLDRRSRSLAEEPMTLSVDSLERRILERSLAERSSAVDVNTAGVESLTRLPGIGPGLAGRIMAERARGGIFRDSADLVERISGIGPLTLGRLSGRILYGDSLEENRR